MEENLDPNLESNLNDLRESLNISRQLIDNAKILYNTYKEGSSELYKGFRDISKSLSKNIEEYRRNTDIFLGDSNKLKDIQKEILKIEKDQIKFQETKTLLEENLIKLRQDRVKAEEKELELEQKLSKANSINYNIIEKKLKNQTKKVVSISQEILLLKSTLNSSKELNKLVEKDLKILKERSLLIEKNIDKINFVKKLYESIAKTPILGGFIDVEKGVNKFQKAQILNKGFWTSLGGSISTAMSPLLKASGILFTIDLAVKAIKFFIDSMFKADKLITDISRKMGISKMEAEGIRDQFIGIQRYTSNLSKTQDGIILSLTEISDTWNQINDSLGTAVSLEGGFLTQMTVLRSKVKLSDEALKGLTLTSIAGEKSAEGIVQNIIAQNNLLRMQGKSAISNYKLIESTLKINGQLRILYKANTDEIAKGVIAAHSMGTTLEQINNIAKGFLDFESSISSELEAQLLSGKNINLDAARYFSLIGDTNNLIKEINKNFPNWAEFTQMNRIAQEGYAKALGMSVDDMSNMVLEQQTLNKLTKENTLNVLGKNNAEAAARLATAKSLKEVSQILNSYKISLEDQKEILGEQAYLNMQNQSAQDKFNAALERAKEAFSNLVTGGTIDRLSDVIIAITDSLSKGLWGFLDYGKNLERQQYKSLEKYADSGNKLAQLALKEAHTVKEEIQGGSHKVYVKEEFDMPLIQAALNKIRGQEDFVLKGNNVIPFRKDDIIMGGTNLDGGNEELKKLNKNIENLISIVKEGKDINLDSYKVGTAISMGTLKTQ